MLVTQSSALYGGRTPLSLILPALHASKLRTLLGVGINKVALGVAHAVKFTDDVPHKGSYSPPGEWKDLNKGQHGGLAHAAQAG